MEEFSRDVNISSQSKNYMMFCGYMSVWTQPQCATDLLVDHTAQAGMKIWKSLLFVTYWPTLPDSLQIRAISLCAPCVMCVSAYVFTCPPAPPSFTELPKRLPGPYLICTHHSNLGLGWQAHFPHSAWSSTAAMPRNNQAPRVVL